MGGLSRSVLPGRPLAPGGRPLPLVGAGGETAVPDDVLQRHGRGRRGGPIRGGALPEDAEVTSQLSGNGAGVVGQIGHAEQPLDRHPTAGFAVDRGR